MKIKYKNTDIYLLLGNITEIKADAIVNAANSSLMGGGGVDGAIHRAGGSVIHEQCIKIAKTSGGCPAGEAVITDGGSLPSKYVIHTVGPVYRGGGNNEAELLSLCYINSMTLADSRDIRHIAFPSISTGIYSYPVSLAAPIAVNTVKDYLSSHPDSGISAVGFILFDNKTYSEYEKIL